MKREVIPTELNIWVLRQIFGDEDRAPNAVRPTDRAHVRRCLHAGLVVVDGRELVLTDAGKAAVR